MKILAFESSGKSASAAVLEDGTLRAERLIQNGFTHSETLLPMIAGVLSDARTELKEISLLTLTNGPGSFTGLRIGLATANGLSLPEKIPIAGISTLYALAYGARHFPGLIAALCDARRKEFYTALFRGGDLFERVTEDKALPHETILRDHASREEKILLVGDGAELYFEESSGRAREILAPKEFLIPRAGALGSAAWDLWNKDPKQFSGEVSLEYLRVSQAEREQNSK